MSVRARIAQFVLILGMLTFIPGALATASESAGCPRGNSPQDALSSLESDVESAAGSGLPSELFSGRDRYRVSNAFDWGEDDLCFLNDPSAFSGRGSAPVQWIADQTGACQGMSAIVRAFKQHARFDCSQSRAADDAVLRKVDEIMALHDLGCGGEVEISGFCSLRDLCRAYRPHFERLAVETNAGLASRDTTAYLSELIEGRSASNDVGNSTEIRRALTELNGGGYPLLVFQYHAVMVTGAELFRRGDGDIDVTIEYYDPDSDRKNEMSLVLAADFSRTLRGGPIFVASPATMTNTCERRLAGGAR